MKITLFIMAQALFGLYFVLFYKMIASLSPDEQKRYRRCGFMVTNTIFVGGAVTAFIVLNDNYVRLAIGVGALAYSIVAGAFHRRRVARAQLPPEFSRRLHRSSIIALIGMTLLLAAFAVDVFQT